MNMLTENNLEEQQVKDSHVKCCYCGKKENLTLYSSTPYPGVYVCKNKPVGECKTKYN